MNVFFALFLAVQQWTMPIRVSPDTLPGTQAAVVADCWGGTWICWYSSGHLWSRSYELGSLTEPSLVDTARCRLPEVTTSSMCRNVNRNAIVAWVDVSHSIRLSTCMIRKGIWVTSAPDPRITGENPAITCDSSGNIWCVWTMLDTSGAALSYNVSYYDGKGWKNPVWLERISPVEITYTAGIAADSEDNIWVSYNDDKSIWVQYWDGDSWSSPESIGECFDYAYSTMCSDSSNVWVAWFNSTANMGEGGIFARYYNGAEWSDLVLLPHHYDPILGMGWHNSHADICVDGEGYLWAGWWETQAVWCPNYLISAGAYRETVWERVGVVDSVVDAWGGYPSIACQDSGVWIVWQSQKEGDWNIYAAHTSITVAEEAAAPLRPGSSISLHNHPNPLSTSTAISYHLPRVCRTDLSIYNIQGQLVRTLVKEEMDAGTHTITWDGTDSGGTSVPSGPYFLRLRAHTVERGSIDVRAGELTSTKKMILVR